MVMITPFVFSFSLFALFIALLYVFLVKRSQVTLKLKQLELQSFYEKEKEMLDRIINAASDTLLCLDHDKKVLFMNKKGEEMTGWKVEEVIGKAFCREVIRVRDSKGHLICHSDCPLEKACTLASREAVCEGMLLTKNGAQAWAELRYSALVDSKGHLSFGILTLRDISQFKKAEHMRLQLTSNIVHELRTPLTYIRGYVDLLLMRKVGGLSEDQEKSLRVIRESVFKLIALIDNLLEVARIEEGKFYLRFGSVRLNHLIQKVVDLAKVEADRKNIVLIWEAQDSFPEIYADGKRLEEVLMNLLSNGLKYTHPGGRIEIALGEEDETVSILVADTGIGIAAEYVKGIFERFARLDDVDGNKPGEGAGLGLNIVKRVVEAHGGKVWVESEMGKGSTFYVQIPKRNVA